MSSAESTLPTAGASNSPAHVVDDGRRSLPPEQRRIGLVFQDHALFPHLTVAGNVGFGIRDPKDRPARTAEMLQLVGLTGYDKRYPHELSGGERQRIALARALALQPALLLLDEPFASLDPNLRTRIRDEVVDILRSTGTPALFVTHDQQEALAIGDRIAVMNSGRIVQLDHPHTVFHQPVQPVRRQLHGRRRLSHPREARRPGASPITDDADLDERHLSWCDPTTSTSRSPTPRTPAEHVAEIVHAEFRGSDLVLHAAALVRRHDPRAAIPPRTRRSRHRDHAEHQARTPPRRRPTERCPDVCRRLFRRSASSSVGESTNEFGDESLDEVRRNGVLVPEADGVLGRPVGADLGFEVRVE